MRYTTVIDITEFPDVYRNHAARIVYLHMALKAGYHDNDRDLLTYSIRRLSYDTGLTVSAVRHALKTLMKHGLVGKAGLQWKVQKWVVEQTITTRPRTKREMQEQIAFLERQKKQQDQDLQSEEKRNFDYEASLASEGRRKLMERMGIKTNNN